MSYDVWGLLEWGTLGLCSESHGSTITFRGLFSLPTVTRYGSLFISSVLTQQWWIEEIPKVGAPTLGGGGVVREHMILPNFPKNLEPP